MHKRTTSRKALAAVCAAIMAGPLEKVGIELPYALWLAQAAAQTAASALRLVRRLVLEGLVLGELVRFENRGLAPGGSRR